MKTSLEKKNKLMHSTCLGKTQYFYLRNTVFFFRGLSEKKSSKRLQLSEI